VPPYFAPVTNAPEGGCMDTWTLVPPIIVVRSLVPLFLGSLVRNNVRTKEPRN
jgi:hypothetical protein